MASDVSARLTRAEGRRFGLTVGSAFLLLGAVLWWRDRRIASTVTGALGVALVLGGLLVPGLLGPIQRAWMGLATVLSRVTTPILLGIVYFVVLAPVGFLRRTLGHRALEHGMEHGGFWVPRGEPRRSDLRRQF